VIAELFRALGVLKAPQADARAPAALPAVGGAVPSPPRVVRIVQEAMMPLPAPDRVVGCVRARRFGGFDDPPTRHACGSAGAALRPPAGHPAVDPAERNEPEKRRPINGLVFRQHTVIEGIPARLWGVLVGTCSTIDVAAPMVLPLDLRREAVDPSAVEAP